MIELIAMASENVVGVRIDGTIEKADIKAIEQAFAGKFDQFDKVSIYSLKPNDLVDRVERHSHARYRLRSGPPLG